MAPVGHSVAAFALVAHARQTFSARTQRRHRQVTASLSGALSADDAVAVVADGAPLAALRVHVETVVSSALAAEREHLVYRVRENADNVQNAHVCFNFAAVEMAFTDNTRAQYIFHGSTYDVSYNQLKNLKKVTV